MWIPKNLYYGFKITKKEANEKGRNTLNECFSSTFKFY